MENASKALIIAGAILLAILLISLGLIVFRNASGTINGANLSKEEIQAFNYQFDGYCGQHKSATEVRNLLQVVMSNNATDADRRIKITTKANSDSNNGVPIATDGIDASGYLTKMPTISSAYKYKVTPTTTGAGIYGSIEIETEK